MPQTIPALMGQIIVLIDFVVVPLIFGVAFVVFIWGVYTYFIQGAGNDEKRKEGRQFIIYGIIGFFVMVSVWGLVNIAVRTFGFDRASRPDLPRFGPTSNRSVGSPTSLLPPAETAPPGAPLDGPNGVGNQAANQTDQNSGLCSPEHPENC